MLFKGEQTSRNSHRIPVILRLLEKAWKTYPDLRFGQLLSNICTGKDLFSIEDDKLMERATQWIDDSKVSDTIAERPLMLFGDLRLLLSHHARLSLCDKETLQYDNFISVRDVPADYDDFLVYGIGLIESEFYCKNEVEYASSGAKEEMEFLPCIEIIYQSEREK